MLWDPFEFAYKPGETHFFLAIALIVSASNAFLGWPSHEWYLVAWGCWLASCLDSTHQRLRNMEAAIRELREMQERQAREDETFEKKSEASSQK